MTEWYYAHGQDRQGPLTAEDLRQRFQRGELSLATLVWREGYPQWKPLSEAVEELQLQNLTSATGNLGTGFDLRGDYTAIDNGTAPLPGTGGGTYSPYAASTTAGSYPDAVVDDGAEVVYAGFWKRFAAASIDGILMSIVIFALVMVGIVMMGGSIATLGSLDSPQASTGLTAFFVLGVYVFPILLQVAYFTMMHASAHQATLGKMAVGIKVVRGDGAQVSFGRSLGRWGAFFGTYVVTCGIAYIASAVMAGVTPRKQALHDMIADTLVVDKWAFTGQPERQRHELGAVTIVVIVITALVAVGYGVLIMAAIGGAASRF